MMNQVKKSGRASILSFFSALMQQGIFDFPIRPTEPTTAVAQ
jgi:hypothetical protein